MVQVVGQGLVVAATFTVEHAVDVLQIVHKFVQQEVRRGAVGQVVGFRQEHRAGVEVVQRVDGEVSSFFGLGLGSAIHGVPEFVFWHKVDGRQGFAVVFEVRVARYPVEVDAHEPVDVLCVRCTGVQEQGEKDAEHGSSPCSRRAAVGRWKRRLGTGGTKPACSRTSHTPIEVEALARQGAERIGVGVQGFICRNHLAAVGAVPHGGVVVELQFVSRRGKW